MVRHAAPGSAVHTAMSGKDAPWPRTDQLLAILIEALTGTKITRPGVEEPVPAGGFKTTRNADGSKTTHIGSGAIPMSEFQSWWDKGGG